MRLPFEFGECRMWLTTPVKVYCPTPNTMQSSCRCLNENSLH